MSSTEHTPLLQDHEGQRSGSSSPSRRKRSVPMRQMFILFALVTVQPFAFEVIFPFINQMILEIGVVDDPERVGFYSGVIESLFSLLAFLAIIPMGELSDRIGRKPVVLAGFFGLSISMSLFGLSRTYWAMLITRCLAGALGGSFGAARVMIAELSDKSTQGWAVAGMVIAYKFGQTMGQPVGGFLAHPERHWDFFDSRFWNAYPFALPCFVAAGIALVVVVIGAFNLKETLQLKTWKTITPPEFGTNEIAPNYDSYTEQAHEIARETVVNHDKPIEKSKYRAVLTPSIIALLGNASAMTLGSEMLFGVYPLFAFTPIQSGGLGLNEAAIGLHMSVRAFCNIVILFVYAPLERRFGALRLYQVVMMTWPICILFPPYLNYLAREGLGSTWWFNFVVLVFFLIWSIATLTWTASGVLANNAAPSAEALATLTGLSQMTIALPSAVAPVLVNSLFALSIRSGIVGGNLVWLILFVFDILMAVHSLFLKENTHDWRDELEALEDEE